MAFCGACAGAGAILIISDISSLKMCVRQKKNRVVKREEKSKGRKVLCVELRCIAITGPVWFPN